MKPWGSQAAVLHFLPPNLPAGQRRWLAGGPGGGKERPWPPHGGGELCGTDCDIRPVQELLGREHVETAMVHAHALNRGAGACAARWTDFDTPPAQGAVTRLGRASYHLGPCAGRADDASQENAGVGVALLA